MIANAQLQITDTNGSVLSNATSLKYLGVWFYFCLSFTTNIDYIIPKTNSKL